MSDSCCAPPAPSADPRYRKILWVALALNFAMFGVEIAGSMRSGSVSLLADAIDFLGDSANYGISLVVLGLAIGWHARASVIKAFCMAAFGTFVLGRAIWSFLQGGTPEPLTMGAIAVLALCVNVGVALMLYRYRTGDSNMRSVWICSRNDAIGNIAVAVAALGVLGTRRAWPDLIVAAGMALLALNGAWTVARHAMQELRPTPRTLVPREPHAS
ncbi:MAG: cation diffusion facilitator family transporter [Caldimonas sp.]